MLRRISTGVVALALAASGGQAAPLTGDQGAPTVNQAVSGDQGALSAKQDGGFALTVIGDKGTTLVNRGTGFSAVAGKTPPLKPGDRIMVRDGAAARITYPDGCNVPVRGIATVDPLSPCNFMAADLPSRKGPPPEPYVPPVAEEPFPYFPVALVAVAGAGIACAVLCFHHNNNNNFPIIPIIPASP